MKYVTFAITFGLLAMLCGSLANASYDAPYTGTTLVERMANEPKTEVNRIKAAIEAQEAK